MHQQYMGRVTIIIIAFHLFRIAGWFKTRCALFNAQDLIANAEHIAQQFGRIGINDFKVFVKSGHQVVHQNEFK